MRTTKALITASTALAVSACNYFPTDSAQVNPLQAAFETLPLGYGAAQSSFSGGAEGAWGPGDRGQGGHGMIGGGLGPGFFGGPHEGRGPFGGGPPPGTNCVFSAGTGRVTCDPQTHDGLTITSSVAYADAAGRVQQAFDSVTTNFMNVRVSVAGTTTRRQGATSIVNNSSDRTITGLAAGSTARTINGVSAGSENTTGTGPQGAFTSMRVAGDTTQGVVVPVRAVGVMTYPTAGTVIRHMRVTMTLSGQSPQTTDRREVVSYDGSTTAKVTITKDGTTSMCTFDLTKGRPGCQ